jgi:hypothetical protein
LGGAFNQPEDKHQTYQQRGYSPGGGYQTSIIETAHHPGGQGREDRYGQAEYKRTEYPDGGRREEYNRTEQDGRSGQLGYGFEHSVESRRTEGGGFQRTEETRYDRPGGEYSSETRTEGYGHSGQYYSQTQCVLHDQPLYT